MAISISSNLRRRDRYPVNCAKLNPALYITSVLGMPFLAAFRMSAMINRRSLRLHAFPSYLWNNANQRQTCFARPPIEHHTSTLKRSISKEDMLQKWETFSATFKRRERLVDFSAFNRRAYSHSYHLQISSIASSEYPSFLSLFFNFLTDLISPSLLAFNHRNLHYFFSPWD